MPDADTTVLKIGFLNNQVDKLLDLYLAEYDVVVIDDQSMDVVRRLNHALFGTILDELKKENE